jgi:hypothetical protein
LNKLWVQNILGILLRLPVQGQVENSDKFKNIPRQDLIRVLSAQGASMLSGNFSVK